jgi:hypothetical protein
LDVSSSGEYFVVAINNDGCVAFSDTITAVFCSGMAATVNLNGNVLSTPDTTGNSFQWHDASGPISGATNSFYGVTTAGMYQVEVTDEYGCNYISNAVNVPLSIEELDFVSVKIYPNPADDLINLEFDSETGVNYLMIVMDITGKRIFTENYQSQKGNNRKTIDVGDFESGIYFIQIKDESGKTSHFRILKK